MKPWELLGRTSAPDGTELTLVRHPSEVAILANGDSLMSSRAHASEDALGLLGCQRARNLTEPCVLIGGLGMGYTLRAALDTLPAGARVVVAELVPVVVEWNRTLLGALAGHPLDDPRVELQMADVAAVLRSNSAVFDAVLLDVDNGPVAMSTSSNAGLYDERGLASLRRALRPEGLSAVWSVGDDRPFVRRLRAAGFTVQRAHAPGRSHSPRKHTIFLAGVTTVSGRV